MLFYRKKKLSPGSNNCTAKLFCVMCNTLLFKNNDPKADTSNMQHIWPHSMQLIWTDVFDMRCDGGDSSSGSVSTQSESIMELVHSYQFPCEFETIEKFLSTLR